MKWKIAAAKVNFSELIRRSEKEPQLIYNRDNMVAVVVSKGAYEEYKRMKEQESQKTLASSFEELSSICAEESYVFEAPSRHNRKPVFP